MRLAGTATNPPGLGAQFGEVTATIHQKLGCVGHITSGCPRDLDEVKALGFQLFGLNPCVSHAYVRLVDFGKPVNIAGIDDPDGRLDSRRQARRLLDSARGGSEAGRGLRGSRTARAPLLESCRSSEFSLEEYIKLRAVTHAKTHE